jgi:hypothetical protein
MKNFWAIPIFILSIFVLTKELKAQTLNLKTETRLLEITLNAHHYSKNKWMMSFQANPL